MTFCYFLSIQASSAFLSGSRSTATETSSVVEEEKVHLGDGVFIRRLYFESMRNLPGHNPSEWATLLLKGVFGDRARHMRCSSARGENTISFSADFLVIAKSLYREWLNGLTKTVDGVEVPLFDKLTVEKNVGGLPAYLAQRAIALNGPRGLQAKVKAAREQGLDVASVLTQHQSEQQEKKRKALEEEKRREEEDRRRVEQGLSPLKRPSRRRRTNLAAKQAERSTTPLEQGALTPTEAGSLSTPSTANATPWSDTPTTSLHERGSSRNLFDEDVLANLPPFGAPIHHSPTSDKSYVTMTNLD